MQSLVEKCTTECNHRFYYFHLKRMEDFICCVESVGYNFLALKGPIVDLALEFTVSFSCTGHI